MEVMFLVSRILLNYKYVKVKTDAIHSLKGTNLEHNKVPHQKSLEEADGNERVESDETSVEVASGDV